MRPALGHLVVAITALGLAAVPLAPAAGGSPTPSERAATATLRASAPAPARPQLRVRGSVVDPGQSFRGLDAVSRRTAWVSGGSVEGNAGKVYRTTDGGRTWQDVSPPRARGLQFRDVEVLGGGTAVVLSVGAGRASRIYRTTDAGRTWSRAFQNREPTAFYNCLDFYGGGRTGLAVSDPVDDRFRVLRTVDAGRSWRVVRPARMPAAEGEFNFAASGDCLVISRRSVSFGTGGARSRIFRSRDAGRTWRATPSRIPAGAAGGVFGLAFRGQAGIAVGGDFEDAADGADASAIRTVRDPSRWRSGGDLRHLGEDVAPVPGSRLLLATGQASDGSGTSLSRDGGRSWRYLGRQGFYTLDCAPRACWAAGADGRVAMLSVRRDGPRGGVATASRTVAAPVGADFAMRCSETARSIGLLA